MTGRYVSLVATPLRDQGISIDFNIQKFSPSFPVAGKTFHKTGITVETSMATTYIGIYNEICHWDLGLG